MRGGVVSGWLTPMASGPDVVALRPVKPGPMIGSVVAVQGPSHESACQNRRAQAPSPFAALEQHLAQWMDDADQRVHGTTHERPCDRFVGDEQAALRPLPARPLPRREQRLRRRVASDAFVDVETVRYSVPYQLVRDHVEHGRVSFSNRELRLDRRIRLPDLSDNLEARLILLSRRLAERDGLRHTPFG